MKKITVILFTSILLVVSLILPTAAADVSDDFITYSYLRKYIEFTSGDSVGWDSYLASDNASSTVALPPLTAMYFMTTEVSVDRSPFQIFHTYHFTFSYEVPDEFPNAWSLAGLRVLEFKNYSNFKVDPSDVNYSTEIGNMAPTTRVFSSSANNGSATLDVVFTVEEETAYNVIAPMLLYANTSDTETYGGRIVLTSVEVFDDFAQEEYDRLCYELQQEIQATVEEGFKAVDEDFEAVKGTLTDIESALTTTTATPDTSTLDEDIEDYTAIESDIFDQIYQPIELPDGTVITTDENTLQSLHTWISDRWNAPGYNADFGLELSAFFEVFMPYIGIVVYMSLLLGLAIAWLTGRRLSG